MLKFFAEKMWVAFAVQKLFTFFQEKKNIRILYIESAKTVNEMTLNELVKLTALWTTGPCLLPIQSVQHRPESEFVDTVWFEALLDASMLKGTFFHIYIAHINIFVQILSKTIFSGGLHTKIAMAI